MDLPAPVSPVSTVRPDSNVRISCSIRTTLRMASPVSMQLRTPSEEALQPGSLFGLLWLEIMGGQQRVGILVPVAARIVVAEHRTGGLRLIRDAARQIGRDQ